MSVDQDWLRQRLEELERIERPSASDGERRAAEWLESPATSRPDGSGRRAIAKLARLGGVLL